MKPKMMALYTHDLILITACIIFTFLTYSEIAQAIYVACTVFVMNHALNREAP